jgi:hypothetical protein
MTSWRPVSPEMVVVAVGEPEPLQPALGQRVDELWNRAREENPELFDGGVFSHHHVDVDSRGRVIRVEGHVVPYSHYLAGRLDHDVSAELGIWVMGVTGLLSCPGGAVAGRRSRTATGSGELELAPAGTIGRSDVDDGAIDVRRCILNELEEELGLSSGDLTSPPVPFALVEDEQARVADVALRMRTTLRFDQIAAIHQNQPGREYDQLFLVGSSASKPSVLSPTSRAVFDAATALLGKRSIEAQGAGPGTEAYS